MAEASKDHVILLVEDEPIIREALAQHLENCGFKIVQAGNAVAAIGLLMQHDAMVDAVFTDVLMPGNMDGLALAKWMMQHRPEIPVIVTSGVYDKQLEAKELCGTEAVSKPFNYDQVAEKIRTAIWRRDSHVDFASR
jgi:DNA-binding NtrC family response regulator